MTAHSPASLSRRAILVATVLLAAVLSMPMTPAAPADPAPSTVSTDTTPTDDPAYPIDRMLEQADAFQALGQQRNALAILRKAQTLADSLNDPRRRAMVLGALGKALWLSGAAGEARHQLERSIALAQQANSPAVAAASLNHLGTVHAEQGATPAAHSAYHHSLELAGQAREPALVVAVLINLARLAVHSNDPQAAQARIAEAARQVQQLPDHRDKAFHLLALGQLRRRLPDAAATQRIAAAQDFATAAALAQRLNDPRHHSYALGYQAQLHEEADHPTEALALYRQAVFAAQQAEAPELLYRWQWPIGRLLRNRGDKDGAILAYRQTVEHLQGLRPDFFTADPSGSSGSFRAKVGDAFTELADLLLQRAALQATPAARDADLRAARDTMEALKTAEVQDYFRDECTTALQARTANLEHPPLHTALLYPILLPDRLVLLLSTAQGLEQTNIAVNRDRLTHTVHTFRRLLEKRTSREYLPPARQLHEWLIQPLHTRLEAQAIHTLVIVPDGPLRTIPLAALHDGQGFLIDRYAIATTPGLSLTDLRPVQRQRIRPLLNGLSQGVQGFPALAYVQEELATVYATFGGKVLENKDFRLETIQQELKETPYSIVHIASHGQFASDVRNTFLLTYDDKLTLDRLERFMALSQYRDHPVELLTLSACQTAVGDDRAALGLAGVAVKAGARSALATLWLINDQAAARLVTAFYRQLQDAGVSKAQALRQAQLQLLADRRYQHPGYWAPFLLIGNWL